jgi:hypothetical protein
LRDLAGNFGELVEKFGELWGTGLPLPAQNPKPPSRPPSIFGFGSDFFYFVDSESCGVPFLIYNHQIKYQHKKC